MPANVRGGVLRASPRSGTERSAAAQSCVRNVGIRLAAAPDDIDNRTERACTGWPDRLFIIDTNGSVAFKSAPSPYGFSTADLEKSLEAVIATRR